MHSSNRLLTGLCAVGLAAGLWVLPGCGGSPKTEKTKTPTPTPTATATQVGPTATPTDEPVVRKTMDEYEIRKRQGGDLVLGKAYEKAIPILTKCLEQKPDDGEVHFYLMMAKGGLEESPSMGSEVYGHAKRVMELMPDTNESSRAMDYIAAADTLVSLGFEKSPSPSPSPTPTGSPNSTPSPTGTPASATPTPKPSPTKPPRSNEPAMGEGEIFIVDPAQEVTLAAPVRMFVTNSSQLGADVKRLWQTEVYPQAVAPATAVRELPKGTKLKLKNSDVYYYNLGSWRAPVTVKNSSGDVMVDANTYLVAGVMALLEEPDGREVKGFLVNQLEKYSADGTSVVLIGNRLKLPRGVPEP